MLHVYFSSILYLYTLNLYDLCWDWSVRVLVWEEDGDWWEGGEWKEVGMRENGWSCGVESFSCAVEADDICKRAGNKQMFSGFQRGTRAEGRLRTSFVRSGQRLRLKSTSGEDSGNNG